jgi:nucleotide-binding universal stress UspA family protein
VLGLNTHGAFLPFRPEGVDMTIDIEYVLIPVDGSEASMDAVEYAIGIADRYGADLHVLYLFGESISRGLEAGDIEKAEIEAQSESVVADVKSMTPDGMVVDSSVEYGFSTSKKTIHPGSVILDRSEELDIDFIVVPRGSIGTEEWDLLEKAAEYVLLYATQPVLSV